MLWRYNKICASRATPLNRKLRNKNISEYNDAVTNAINFIHERGNPYAIDAATKLHQVTSGHVVAAANSFISLKMTCRTIFPLVRNDNRKMKRSSVKLSSGLTFHRFCLRTGQRKVAIQNIQLS